METIKDRINEIRDHYRLSNRGFAASLGTKPAATNNYLNGTKEPSLEFIMAILSKYVGISSEWLLRGDGQMFKQENPSDEKLMREVADLRMQLLVQQGITKELRSMLLEKNNGKIPDERKSLVG